MSGAAGTVPFALGKGLVVGFSIAAPVGAIGALCIRRTLARGRGVGLASGLGAAIADAAYGALAAFGLTAATGHLLDWAWAFRLGGGAFLVYLGVRTVVSPVGMGPTDTGAEPSAIRGPATPAGRKRAVPTELAWAATSTFFLTLTNPTTILSFAAVFAGLGLGGAAGGAASGGAASWWRVPAPGPSSPIDPSGQSVLVSQVALVAGVFAGSAGWWLMLTTAVGAFRSRFDVTKMRWVNRVSGAIIVGFGIAGLVAGATSLVG